MAILGVVAACTPPASGPAAVPPTAVTLATEDGARLEADLYGQGEHGIVLAHGGRLDKASWAPEAAQLAAQGWQVLAFNFRGYGGSTGPGQGDPYSAPLQLDVLAAVRYLRAAGVTRVSVIGGSMGGSAASAAAIAARPGEIDDVVLLAAPVNGNPEELKGRVLFLVARDDTTAAGVPRLVRIQEQFDRAPEPKRLLVVDGAEHAQWLFRTTRGDQVLREIVAFLSDGERGSP
ncbi:MAG TPA: alpha/beta fold hydrolase [Gemmatimonadales bacterium]|nr:alpha/beta fold hydrolase [Gemmatimonadales bacterium]